LPTAHASKKRLESRLDVIQAFKVTRETHLGII